jgi:hypothetical protein
MIYYKATNVSYIQMLCIIMAITKSKVAFSQATMFALIIALFASVTTLTTAQVNAQAPATAPSPSIQSTTPHGSVTITTSAGNNQVFFGQAAVQVVIIDPNARSGAGVTQSTIPVSIVAESTEGKTVAGDTFDIPETVLGSGKFELYLAHHDSAFANGAGIHPLNTFGVAHPSSKNQTFQLTTPGIGKSAPVITFGIDGDLNTGTKLFQPVFFKILYGSQQVLLFYGKTPSQLVLDRDTYGSNSIVHVFIADQAANLNPTVPDKFTLTGNNVNLLFTLAGGIFNDKNNITFTETGPNSAVFEAALPIGYTIHATSKSLILTLHDKSDYNDIGSTENDNLTDSSKASFNIEDTDGQLSVPDLITFRNGLMLNISDPDENKDSEVADNILKRVTISIEDGDSETVNMIETQANSGVFVIDNHDNILKTSFTSGATRNDNGQLEFKSDDLHNDILVRYSDPHNHDGAQQIFTTKLKLHTTPGTITLPSSILLKDNQFVLAINDSDLNVNTESKDSYTFTPIGNKPVPLAMAGMKLDSFAQIQMQVEPINKNNNNNNNNTASTAATTSSFNGNKTFTFVETDLDTGVFEAKMNIKDIADLFGRSINVGDKIIITYFDNMEPRPSITSKSMIIRG